MTNSLRDTIRAQASSGLIVWVPALLGWLLLYWGATHMESPAARLTMPMSDWSAGELVAVFIMWAVMMAAMMLPTAMPMVSVFGTLNRRRGKAGRTIAFVAGYFALWAAFAAAATGAQWALQTSGLLSPMIVSMSPALSAALLLIAGAFQFTPLKRACLRACRSPLGFLLTDWRNGLWGAARMGVRHGLYCLGCCWALMALLFVGGAMNLLWIAALTLLVADGEARSQGRASGEGAGRLDDRRRRRAIDLAGVVAGGSLEAGTAPQEGPLTEIAHRTVEANGIAIHLAEAGSGPVVLLCHGFPESWYSWRHQLKALAEAGYRAVAPDMRGYGQTGQPQDIDQYTLFHLVGDMVGVLDALGAPQAVVVGHDWGAPVAWHCALLRPDRFRAVAGLSVPFSSARLQTADERDAADANRRSSTSSISRRRASRRRSSGAIRATTIRRLLYSGSGDAPRQLRQYARRPGAGHGSKDGRLPHPHDRSADAARMAHRGGHRCLRGRVRPRRLPRRAQLVSQHRPQLGAARALRRAPR